MAEFALGLGSNLGDRMGNLREAVRFIMSRPMVGAIRLSAVYETPPLEGVEGGDFYNCVLVGSFFGPAEELHGYCREAEILMGSMTRKNSAERTLDVDLLLFGDEIRDTDELILPHPAIAGRRFVLAPLAEVWHGPLPGLGSTPEELLKGCGDESDVTVVFDLPSEGSLWEVDG